MVVKAAKVKGPNKRGGARPGAGRPKVARDPNDPMQGQVERNYIRNQIRWYLDLCEGDNLSQKIENLVVEHAAMFPLGPGKARPRGEGGRFLKGKDPLQFVREMHAKEVS